MISQVQNFSTYFKCFSNRLDDTLQALTFTEKHLSLVPDLSMTPEFLIMMCLPSHLSSPKLCKVQTQKLQQFFFSSLLSSTILLNSLLQDSQFCNVVDAVFGSLTHLSPGGIWLYFFVHSQTYCIFISRNCLNICAWTSHL